MNCPSSEYWWLYISLPNQYPDKLWKTNAPEVGFLSTTIAIIMFFMHFSETFLRDNRERITVIIRNFIFLFLYQRNLLVFMKWLTPIRHISACDTYYVCYNQSQKFWDNSMKHNLLGFSLEKLKDSSIKTPLSLPYINVVGQ